MSTKNLSITLGLLAITILAIAFPMATYAEPEDTGNFIFINYVGQEMVFDLDDVVYTIPGTNIAPDGGRLVLQLPPGFHKYAANIPGVPTGSAGEFEIATDGVVAKAARLEQTTIKVDLNGEVVALPEDYVYVFDFDPFAAPVIDSPVVDTWQPAAAPAGQGSMVWVNHYGNDELTLDLGGTIYKVPAHKNNIPGHLQIDLAPGQYRYTVSVPYGSQNGEIEIVAGQVTGFDVTAEVAEMPDYDLGDEYDFSPSVTLFLNEKNLTDDIASATTQPAADEAPGTLPQTGGEIMVPEVVTPGEGLTIKNYTGDALVFTINDQTYTIADNAQQTLDLPPGEYNYTASLPFVATTGTVNLTANPGLELSIALDVTGDFLNAYPN